METMLNSRRDGAIIIPIEDETVHSSAYPFCSKMSCFCHENEELIISIQQQVLDGLLTIEEADRLFRGQQI